MFFPLPFSHLFAAVSSCKQNKNTTWGKRRGERMWQAIDMPTPHKLWFFTVPYARIVSFILSLHGCFWIITGYKLAFFSACLSFKVSPLIMLLLLFKVNQQNKSIANSLVQFSKLSTSGWWCAYKVIFSAAVHVQAREPCINPQLQWPFL